MIFIKKYIREIIFVVLSRNINKKEKTILMYLYALYISIIKLFNIWLKIKL